MENMMHYLEDAMKDQAFVNALVNAQTAEEAQQVFASRGVELTLEEVKAVGAGLRAQTEGGELTEDELDLVAGGITLVTVWNVVKIVAGTVKIVNFAGKRFGWW